MNVLLERSTLSPKMGHEDMAAFNASRVPSSKVYVRFACIAGTLTRHRADITALQRSTQSVDECGRHVIQRRYRRNSRSHNKTPSSRAATVIAVMASRFPAFFAGVARAVKPAKEEQRREEHNVARAQRLLALKKLKAKS